MNTAHTIAFHVIHCAYKHVSLCPFIISIYDIFGYVWRVKYYNWSIICVMCKMSLADISWRTFNESLVWLDIAVLHIYTCQCWGILMGKPHSEDDVIYKISSTGINWAAINHPSVWLEQSCCRCCSFQTLSTRWSSSCPTDQHCVSTCPLQHFKGLFSFLVIHNHHL